MSFDPFVGDSRERSRTFGDYLAAFRRQRALPLKLISAKALFTAYGLDSGWEAALLLLSSVPVLGVLWYPVWRYFLPSGGAVDRLRQCSGMTPER